MDTKQALGLLEMYTRKMALSADEHDNLNRAVKVLAEALGMLAKPVEAEIVPAS